MKEMKFKSKQDWWLTLLAWGAMIFVLGNSLYVLVVEPSGVAFLVFGLTLMVNIFIAWMVLTIEYIVTENALIIKYGPFKHVILLHEIKTLRKTMNPLSSPALSLKRIEITYGKHNMTLISPPNRDKFIQLLLEKCPNATWIK